MSFANSGNINLRKMIALSAMAGFLLPVFFISAQQTNLNLGDVCENDAKIEAECDKVSKADCRKILEDCQGYFEAKKAEVEKEVAQTAKEKKTLKTQIGGLDQKIKDMSYQINQSNLAIKDLTFQIDDTKGSIDKTSNDIEEQKRKLGLVLQATFEEDQKSDVEVVLGNNTLSNFYDNLVYLENLSSKSRDLLDQIRTMKNYLEDQKSSLENKTEDLKNTVAVREIQKQENSKTKKDKEYYLGLTEAQYNQQVKEQQNLAKKAAEIKARIFDLAGVADTDAPNFEQAYQMAKTAGNITGVRPAFLLAILTQESNLGKNVGQCYVTNFTTGAGKRATGQSIANVMKPTRDVNPFKKICADLDKDPAKTLVSCPIASVGGYGGAMGPGQFIPSTWNIYRTRLEAILQRPGNPWNINDAFIATGLYAADSGAKAQTYNSEWRAAMIYFAGSVNLKYRFYGDNVMAIANGYADDIAAIEGK
ncbi:MAG: lytic murein transglycosylase [Candidatus Paceibacterota bacterium]